MKLPKYPKGLKTRISKLETKIRRKKAVAARKAEIARDKKRVETLRNQLRK